MKELAQLHCIPIRGDTPKLSEENIALFLSRLPGWQVLLRTGEPRLEKAFRFKNFSQAMDFTQRVARAAEDEDHHPAILTEWGMVTVTWWTHRIRGLHQNDFIMAAKTEGLFSTEVSDDEDPTTHKGMHDNRSMPPGKIIPELVYDDLDSAVRWLCQVFGFKERLRIGNHRSQLVLEDASMIAVGKNDPPEIKSNYPEQPHPARQADHSIMVRLKDVEQHFQRATQFGARVINPPADFPYGERQYSVEDIGGHLWTFSQSIADVDPEDWGGRSNLQL